MFWGKTKWKQKSKEASLVKGAVTFVSECLQRIRLRSPLTRDLHRPPAALGQRPQKVPHTRTSDLVADHARMLVPFYPRSHPRPCLRTGKSMWFLFLFIFFNVCLVHWMQIFLDIYFSIHVFLVKYLWLPFYATFISGAIFLISPWYWLIIWLSVNNDNNLSALVRSWRGSMVSTDWGCGIGDIAWGC